MTTPPQVMPPPSTLAADVSPQTAESQDDISDDDTNLEETVALGNANLEGAFDAGEPALVLADEPSSALDDANTEKFFDLLMAGLDRQRQVLLVVSHDARLAPRFDRVINMEDLTKETAIGGARE